MLFLGSAFELSAQQLTAERKQFEATKARAEKGDLQAQVDLGLLYAAGNGVAKDLGKAAKWHRKAADQGFARAQFLLAMEYAQGAGLKPDQAEAARWFRRAADQSLPEAQFALGKCYANGEGVSEDVVQAVNWYKRAADQNFVEAEGELGQCFLDGTGLTTDIVEGVKWIRKAAEQGYAPAQNRLGLCYLKGEGVTRDLVQAYKWLNLGAAQGGATAADAKMDLAKAELKMTPQQVAEAQRLAHDFKPHIPPAESLPSLKNPDERSGISPGVATIATSQGGLLSVDAQDTGCEVYVDGSFVGNPPAKLHLQEGSHVVEVKRPGFRDYRKELKVSNGAELNLHVTLEKQ